MSMGLKGFIFQKTQRHLFLVLCLFAFYVIMLQFTTVFFVCFSVIRLFKCIPSLSFQHKQDRFPTPKTENNSTFTKRKARKDFQLCFMKKKHINTTSQHSFFHSTSSPPSQSIQSQPFPQPSSVIILGALPGQILERKDAVSLTSVEYVEVHSNEPLKTCWIHGCKFLVYPITTGLMNVGSGGVKYLSCKTTEGPLAVHQEIANRKGWCFLTRRDHFFESLKLNRL